MTLCLENAKERFRSATFVSLNVLTRILSTLILYGYIVVDTLACREDSCYVMPEIYRITVKSVVRFSSNVRY